MMVATILVCVGLILAGAVEAKPVGWVVLALGVVALLYVVLGPHIVR